MKSTKAPIIVLFLIILIISGCSMQGNIEEQDSMTETEIVETELIEISHLMMIDDQRGWSHYKNQLLKSNDGGLTWQNRGPDLEYLNANEFFILNDQVAWIHQQVNDRLLMYHTTNAGHDWTMYSVDIEGSSPRLFFLNEHDGWLMTTIGNSMFHEEVVLYHTIDGGISWNKINSNLDVIYGRKDLIMFKNRKEGWLSNILMVEDEVWLLHTIDGGVTWEKQYLPTYISLEQEFSHVTTPVFIDERKGITLIHTSCEDSPCTLFYSTVNGGKEWNYVSAINHGNPNRLLMIDVVDNKTIWAAQQDHLFISQDFGKEWREIPVNLDVQIEQIDFISEKVGWIVIKTKENSFKLLLTEDGGLHWRDLFREYILG